jgi:cation:H+ antiporter
MIYFLVFLASGLVVVAAGTALARQADAIAEATGLGRLWIGSILLAGATSLPELTTDIAAVRMGAADLAVGDLFGSSMANMLILALIDLLARGKRVLRSAAVDHGLAASLAIALNLTAGVLVMIRADAAWLGIGPGAVLLALGYVAGTRAVYRHAIRDAAPATVTEASEDKSERRPVLRRSVLAFSLAAIVVLGAAPAFAWAARGIAALTGLGNTFVGTWLVGLATSLPELVASLAAVRIGALDLAVGNLFGSNAFNMAIFLPLDAVQPGSLFAMVDSNHALSAMFAAVLMAVGLGAIFYRANRRFAMIEPDSFLILLTYGLALWLLYQQSRG